MRDILAFVSEKEQAKLVYDVEARRQQFQKIVNTGKSSSCPPCAARDVNDSCGDANDSYIKHDLEQIHMCARFVARQGARWTSPL